MTKYSHHYRFLCVFRLEGQPSIHSTSEMRLQYREKRYRHHRSFELHNVFPILTLWKKTAIHVHNCELEVHKKSTEIANLLLRHYHGSSSHLL